MREAHVEGGHEIHLPTREKLKTMFEDFHDERQPVICTVPQGTAGSEPPVYRLCFLAKNPGGEIQRLAAIAPKTTGAGCIHCGGDLVTIGHSRQMIIDKSIRSDRSLIRFPSGVGILEVPSLVSKSGSRSLTSILDLHLDDRPAIGVCLPRVIV